MKKILFALVAIFTLGISNVAADNDKLINKSELPAKAQQFIDKYYANVKLTYAKMEREFLERTYEVVLADGTKLEFTCDGNWKEVSWNTIWSNTGSAGDVIYPYFWHWIY